MSQCKVTKSDGTRCRGNAGEGEYCPIHRRRFAKNVTHGRYAKPEIAHGVPLQYAGLYQEFIQDDKPFDLRREMALLRTLFVETRNNLDAGKLDKANKIEEAIVEQLSASLKGSPEKMRPLLTLIGQTVRQVLDDELDITSGMDLDEAEGLGRLLETISRVAERMKKIQEGVKLQVQIDTNILVRFLQHVVFPEIPEVERRQRMIMRASRMGISRVEQLPAVGDEEVLRVEIEDRQAEDTAPVRVGRNRSGFVPPDALQSEDVAGSLLPLDVSPWD